MASKEPRPLPKSGEPGHRDPSKPWVASPPPPPRRDRVMDSRMAGGMTRSVVLPDSHDKLVRSDERKRLLLERAVRALDGVEACARYGELLADIEAELSKG